MATRIATSIIVKATTTNHEGEERTAYFGPFLPHAGSATKHFINTLDQELDESGRYQSWELETENVFIAADESDCAVQATR